MPAKCRLADHNLAYYTRLPVTTLQKITSFKRLPQNLLKLRREGRHDIQQNDAWQNDIQLRNINQNDT